METSQIGASVRTLASWTLVASRLKYSDSESRVSSALTTSLMLRSGKVGAAEATTASVDAKMVDRRILVESCWWCWWWCWWIGIRGAGNIETKKCRNEQNPGYERDGERADEGKKKLKNYKGKTKRKSTPCDYTQERCSANGEIQRSSRAPSPEAGRERHVVSDIHSGCQATQRRNRRHCLLETGPAGNTGATGRAATQERFDMLGLETCSRPSGDG